ncbi:MAG TPA: ABC transporter ATP-binding protein [Thermoanaerobaculia bacterium]|nr:ABC transporter ATP-binding protein [Thermoanaerobaculia bacterium]
MSIELHSVTYRYPGAPSVAVDGVSFRIAKPELIAICGANGSGKSTLMKLLSRVLEPSDGTIVMEGREIGAWDPRDYARKVGYLPQETDPLVPMRAIDAVITGRAPYLGRFSWESPQDIELARLALARCDASGLADRHLDEMSGGERKRVHLARVLAGQPQAILLDEPLAALDLAHAQQLARLLRVLVEEEKRTVILISHDLNWSAAIADRMLVLREARLTADGSPSAILTPELIHANFGLEADVIERNGRRWVLPR